MDSLAKFNPPSPTLSFFYETIYRRINQLVESESTIFVLLFV